MVDPSRRGFAVIDEGGFRGAARKLLVTQPPLSREIQRLERELGAVLFDRTSRPVAPTAFGAAYAAEVREVLARLDRAADVARRAIEPQVRIRVGFISAVANDLLPRAVRAFRAAHPDVALVLEEQPSGADMLASGIQFPPALRDFLASRATSCAGKVSLGDLYMRFDLGSEPEIAKIDVQVRGRGDPIHWARPGTAKA